MVSVGPEELESEGVSASTNLVPVSHLSLLRGGPHDETDAEADDAGEEEDDPH